MAKPDIDRAGSQMLRWSSTNDLVAGNDEVAGDDSGSSDYAQAMISVLGILKTVHLFLLNKINECVT